MSRAKQQPKQRHSSKLATVLGTAAWLTLANVASDEAVADAPTRNVGAIHQVFLGEEEVADVSLATFFLFDKETRGRSPHGQRFCRGRRWRLLDRHVLHIVRIRK